MKRYGYPDMERYLECEKKTFKHLESSHLFRSNFPDCIQEIDRVFSIVSSFIRDAPKKKRKKCGKLIINPTIAFVAELEGKKHNVKLCSNVEFEEDRLVSSVQIIEIFGSVGSINENKIISRIHFDVAIPGETNKQHHPLYHVQVGGEAKGDVEIVGDHGLSLPRIPYRPMTSAMFFDMAIRELDTDEHKQFIKEGSWIEIVRENEELMYYSFVEEISRRKSSNHNFVLSDLYYEA